MMIKPFQTLIVAGMLFIAGAGLPAFASETPRAVATGAAASDDAARAQALLAKAVAAYQANPRQALVDFSLVGPYMDGDLYVYVVGEDGVMRASGGPSMVLVGRDVRNLKDADGKLFIGEMVVGSRLKESGSMEYRWLNREHGRVERKLAYFQKVGDAIVAVGYYIPRSTPQEARVLLGQAVEAVKRDPKAAFAKFNDINGGYARDDLYVFVVGIDNLVMYASGASPRLIGRKVDHVMDINGQRIYPQSVQLATAKASGGIELQYTWLNPVTGMKEHKTTYLERVGDYAVGVGYYQPQPRN